MQNTWTQEIYEESLLYFGVANSSRTIPTDTRNDIACAKSPPNTTNRCRRRLPTEPRYEI